MREALRRLLWLGPTLVGVTVLAFWAITRALGTPSDQPALPLFFNPAPSSVRELSWQAALEVASAGPAATAAEDRLARLGGAALPHVLPRLDSLNPVGRQRVARALTPLAARMDTAVEQTLREDDSAAEFWSRFWDDHFVDFNPVIVKRVVTRYAQRASELRRRELWRLDTFALDEILRQMNDAAKGDWERLQRLSEAAAHVTGLPWALEVDASADAARQLNARWQAWWIDHRNQYVTLQGVERLLSPLLQTRYASWVQESVRSRFGVLSDGRPALQALAERAPITVALFLVGLIGGTLLGLFSGTSAALLRPRAQNVVEATLGVLLLGVPLAIYAVGGAPETAGAKVALAVVAMASIGAVLVNRYQRTSSAELMRQNWVRAYRAVGVSRARLALFTLRPSSNLAISALAPHTSTLLTCVFVLEFALGIDGLGPTTLEALARREVAWVMLMSAATAALVGVIQLSSDVLLARLDPLRGGAGGREPTGV